jgi:hypothetical protein
MATQIAECFGSRMYMNLLYQIQNKSNFKMWKKFKKKSRVDHIKNILCRIGKNKKLSYEYSKQIFIVQINLSKWLPRVANNFQCLNKIWLILVVQFCHM